MDCWLNVNHSSLVESERYSSSTFWMAIACATRSNGNLLAMFYLLPFFKTLLRSAPHFTLVAFLVCSLLVLFFFYAADYYFCFRAHPKSRFVQLLVCFPSWHSRRTASSSIVPARVRLGCGVR